MTRGSPFACMPACWPQRRPYSAVAALAVALATLLRLDDAVGQSSDLAGVAWVGDAVAAQSVHGDHATTADRERPRRSSLDKDHRGQ